MSVCKTKMPLMDAERLAAALIRELSPACVRIAVAGSIRRRKSEIGDIEIVAIPKRRPGLFDDDGPGQTHLDMVISDLVLQDRMERFKDGPKYKHIHLNKPNCMLDLFLVTKETWGMQMAIRTGPAEFSKRLVTVRRHGGMLPDRMAVKDGRIWVEGEAEPLDTEDERRVFELIGSPWIEPWDRA